MRIRMSELDVKILQHLTLSYQGKYGILIAWLIVAAHNQLVKGDCAPVSGFAPVAATKIWVMDEVSDVFEAKLWREVGLEGLSDVTYLSLIHI